MIDALQTTERPGEAFEVQWRHAIKRRVVFVLTAIALWGLVVRGAARLAPGHPARLLRDDRAQAAAQPRDGRTRRAATSSIATGRCSRRRSKARRSRPICPRSRIRSAPRRSCAWRCATARRRKRPTSSRQLSRKRYFAYVRRWRSVSSEQLERVKALELPGISFMPEPGRYYPNGVAGRAPARVRRRRQRGTGGTRARLRRSGRRPAWELPGPAGRQSRRCRRASRCAPVPGATLELTIDRDLQYIAERELEAGGRRTTTRRAARRSSWIRAPARSSRSRAIPTFNPNAPGARPPTTRGAIARCRTSTSRVHVQDRHRVGGHRRGRAEGDRSDRLQSRRHHLPGPQADHRGQGPQLRPDSVRRRHRQVEQRRRDQGRACASAPSG